MRRIGALLPSSRALAEALCAGIDALRGGAPRRLLEVGGGTGAVTRSIARRLGPADRLVVYEIDPALAEYLRTDPALAALDGRLDVRVDDVRSLPPEERYDSIVASLPFQSLETDATIEIWRALLAALAPGATLSFFRYAFFPALWALLPSEAGRRLRAARAALDGLTAGRIVGRQLVWRNVPPAWAIRAAAAPAVGAAP